jgi:hypothetical protein
MTDFKERNTQNAQHSTGPTSDDGKERSSRNSLVHGLYSRIPYDPKECLDDYLIHRAALMAALKPEDAFQEELAKIIIDNLWRVEKYRMKEAQMTNDTYETVESRGRHEQRLLNSMFKARKELKALQTESAEARKAEAQRLEDQAKIKAAREIPVEKDNPFSAEPASGKQPAGFVPHTPENRPASPAIPSDEPSDQPSEPSKKPVESEKRPAA